MERDESSAFNVTSYATSERVAKIGLLCSACTLYLLADNLARQRASLLDCHLFKQKKALLSSCQSECVQVRARLVDIYIYRRGQLAIKVKIGTSAA